MKFSVIIPVYNREDLVCNAVESVISQTYKNWELIIVNDGSTDGTGNILKQYEDNEKIKVIYQPNGGVSSARNKGLENSTGDYFAFLDSDDLWLPNHLSVLAEIAHNYPDAGFLATYAEIHMENNVVIKSCAFFDDKPETVYYSDFFDIYSKDKRAKMFALSTTCVSKEAALRAGGFKVGCKIGEDMAYTLFIAAYFPVVLTGRATAWYNKVNSIATKDDSFDPDWYFFNEINKIKNDNSIPYDKRGNFEAVMQWFLMRRTRHYLINCRRKEAIEGYKTVDKSKLLLKDKIINIVLFCLPCCLIKKIFLIRWKRVA